MDKIYGAQTDAQKALDAAKQELSNAETERDAQRAQAKAEADKAAADAARAAADATTAQAEALAAQTSANAQLAKARADAINGQLQGGTGNTPTQTKKSAFPPPVDKNLVKLPANTRMGSLEEMKEFVSAQQDKLDSLGDIAMEKQMRLQMYMDAYAQTASMISNVQKKASETATTIIGNMK
jgi:multidrug efflux pump subunit AcrA (membrane-fusion protein)